MATAGNHADATVIMTTSSGGFTMVEILISLAIFSLVGIAMLVFQNNTNSLSNIIHSNLASQQQTRKFLRDITAQLRTASQANTGSYAIAEAGANTLTFYSDTDNDGVREKIRYFTEGTTLKKGSIIPSGSPLAYNQENEKKFTMVQYVTNGATPIFSYFNALYEGTLPPLEQPVNPLAIRLVKITLILDQDPNRTPAPVTVSTQISIRNLKDNL